LEEGWCASQSKVHDFRDIGAERGFEGCLVLVFWSDAYVVVALADVKFREQAFSMKSLNGVLDVG
jgi:hypothetical protein